MEYRIVKRRKTKKYVIVDKRGGPQPRDRPRGGQGRLRGRRQVHTRRGVNI
jgi:hypothetical protein